MCKSQKQQHMVMLYMDTFLACRADGFNTSVLRLGAMVASCSGMVSLCATGLLMVDLDPSLLPIELSESESYSLSNSLSIKLAFLWYSSDS